MTASSHAVRIMRIICKDIHINAKKKVTVDYYVSKMKRLNNALYIKELLKY